MDFTDVRELLQDIRDVRNVLVAIYSIMTAAIVGACLILLFKHGTMEKIFS